MSDQDRPKSSWQSWVRAAETRRSSGSESADGLDLQSAEDDADLDVVLSWGDQPSSQPGGRGSPDPDGELEEVNEAAETEAASTVGADADTDDASWSIRASDVAR